MSQIDNIDKKVFGAFYKHGHSLHRLSLGLIFIWFGLLKPFGEETTTSLLAHTIYFFSPETILPLLGWWEVVIGFTLILKPLVKYSIILQLIRIPGTILAFIVHPQICFIHIPFVPSPEGQYLIKDLIILLAGVAIAGTVYKETENSGLLRKNN